MKANHRDCGLTEGYLNHIRCCLWKGKPHGRAALMVGAGFSLNAEYVSGKTTNFPQWRDLAKAFADRLCLSGGARSDVPALELAARFEAVYERGALHDLILSELPDSGFRPGELHVRLLDLPWADVFTTNYDTLLDRAKAQVSPERSYRTIRRIEGLPGSKQPRIVKLHGSFPDTYPFIITEDDFRTYPQRYAPFVNTVQQSMMENEFCLLGFSGDDPNFVNWTGWVRDNLKENCPKIYLCGVFGELDLSKIEYLKKRNVTLVDLRFFSLDNEKPDHATLIGRFIDYLRDGRPPEPGDWAKPRDGGKSGLEKDSSPSQDVQVMQYVAELRELRETYPGWIVCPKDIRSRYWDRFKNLVWQADWPNFKSIPLEARLESLCEFAWGLNVCLAPIPQSIREQMALALEDDLTSNRGNLSWFAVEIALGLMRDARGRFDKTSYERWRGILQPLYEETSATSTQRLALHYEDCLYAWYELDFGKLLLLVEQWPSDGNPPVWSLRHASLLLVIGEGKSAWKRLESTLLEIRKRLVEEEGAVQLLSEESWVMYLLQYRSRVRNAGSGGAMQVGSNNKIQITSAPPGRWDELRRYHCDPFRELSGVSNSARKKSKRDGEYETFDPGIRRVTRTIGLGNGIPSETGFGFEAFSRLHEDAGCPMNFACYRTAAHELDELLPSLSMEKPEAFFSHVTRFYDMDSIVKMSRFQVLAMDADVVRDWYRSTESVPTFLISVLSSGRTDGLEGPRWVSILNAYLEIVSRLTIRFDEELLDNVLELACNLYVNSVVRIKFQIHESLGNLFRRALAALSEEKLVAWTPRLLELPLGDANGTPVSVLDRWPEPFHFIEWTSKPLSKSDLRAEAAIGYLLSQLRSGSSGALRNRARAIERLYVLHSGGGLDDAGSKEFARELWRKKDPDSGLPVLEDYFYMQSLLVFPEPSRGQSVRELKKFLKSQNLSDLYEQTKGEAPGTIYPPPFLRRIEPILEAWLGCTKIKWREVELYQGRQISWSQHAARSCLTDLLKLWVRCREEFVRANERGSSVGDPTHSLRYFGERICTLATKILLPYANLEKGETIDAVYGMFQDMSSLRVPVVHNAHMFLWSDWGFEESVCDIIRTGLRPIERNTLEHAYMGVLHWALMSKSRESSGCEVPREFVRTLLSHTLGRDCKGYHTLLEVDAYILEETELFTVDDKAALCDALEAISRDASDPKFWQSRSYAEFSESHRLAAALTADYKTRAEPIPDILGAWQTNAKQIELPDLLRHWEIRTSRTVLGRGEGFG